MYGRYDNITYADGTKEKSDPTLLQNDIEQRDDVVLAPNGNVEEERLHTKEDSDGQSSKDGERKKGVLRKLGLHKA